MKLWEIVKQLEEGKKLPETFTASTIDLTTIQKWLALLAELLSILSQIGFK